MLSKRDFRVILLHEFKLGHNATESTHNIRKAWGNIDVSERTAQRWFKKFRTGDTSLQEEEGRGRPASIDNDELRAIIEANPITTTRKVAKELKVAQSTVVCHLEEIGKVKKLDKWIPYELTASQKDRRLEVAFSLVQRNKNDPFLDRIVTCDEKWIQYDNRRRSAQWLDHDESPKHFPKPKLHPRKIMVTVWWSAAGLIHYSFLKLGQTITGDIYCQQIEEMHQKLRQMNPALVNRKGPILLHDNARPHVAKVTLKKLNALGYELLPHPPYSPDLSPTDYHFFKHLEIFLKDQRFDNEDATKNAFLRFIDSRTPEFYASGINKLYSRWQMCVEHDGSYFD